MHKQHILDEIRRTANENGGVPLGRERFLTETGIREADWIGKYWVRWSDAVREAGYVPNEMQSGMSDEHLLERYALLIRELGRVPTVAELKLRRRSDEVFPSHNTFARFGSRQELLAKVQAYSRARGLDDVAMVVERQLPKSNPTKESVRSDESEVFGFVYLIKAGRFYKIGKTNSVGRRERELAIQLPERTITLHTIRTDDPNGIESYWHRRFEAKRKNGEWFCAAPGDS